MPRPRLMTPGPVPVPEEVLLGQARQVRHHRTEEFRRLLAEIQAGLQYVFQTQNEVAILTSSGTGAMEAAVASCVPRGGKAIVLESGKFAERWRQLCEAFGIDVVRVETPWGECFTPEQVDGPWPNTRTRGPCLPRSRKAAPAWATTSRRSAASSADTPALLVVDAISGAGVMECRTDAWGIDVLVVGSQKALHVRRGWRLWPSARRHGDRSSRSRGRRSTSISWPTGKHWRESETPYTPAISLLVGLAESLRLIRAEGIETIWARARMLARATQAGVRALGLRLVARRPAEGLTAVYFPEGVDGRKLLAAAPTAVWSEIGRRTGPPEGEGIPHCPHGTGRRTGHRFDARRPGTGTCRTWPIG